MLAFFGISTRGASIAIPSTDATSSRRLARMDESTMSLGIAYGLQMIVHCALAIALLVIGATTVRRAHAGAGWLVSLSAGIQLLGLCVATLSPMAMSRAGTDAFVRWDAVGAHLGTLFSLASGGAMITALVQLASRPGTGARGD